MRKEVAHRVIMIALIVASSACSTMKSVLALQQQERSSAPIHNPFPDFYQAAQAQDNIVIRTKKGDRAVEVEVPGSQGKISDFEVPLSPAFSSGSSGRYPAQDSSASQFHSPYRDRAPGIADREITSRLAGASFGNESDRREIEGTLGVIPADNPIPERDSSYLAALDQVKLLYRAGRFEAALLETDELLRNYPTDPKLYEMRGTLFERIGQSDLAIQSWTQALRIDPSNKALRRFIERKQLKRGLASP